TKNKPSPFVSMLLLELQEKPVLAEAASDAEPCAQEPEVPAASAAPTTKVSGDGSAAKGATAVRRIWMISRRRLILLATIVLGVRIFIGEASVVPTASMEGTILVGDHLFMDKLLYGPEIPLVNWRLPALRTVQRGEIIVFHYPKDPSETFLKRVAATG